MEMTFTELVAFVVQWFVMWITTIFSGILG